MTDGAVTYLDQILAAKRAALHADRHEQGVLTRAQLEAELARVGPCKDFAAALRRGPAPRVIAEFKRASPTLGTIRRDADVVDIVRSYEHAGAAAVSVLADAHFAGSLDDVRAAAASLAVPVLCKDFILDRRQVLAARRAGADAILLIVMALPPPQLRPLIECAHELGMQVLCETHDAHEVDRAMSAGARIVGVNARDLRTFAVDLGRVIELRSRVPESFVFVAESGISTRDDVARLRDARVDAILVGTSLMSADDPGQALRELVAETP